MIIRYPTGLYKRQIPSEPSDVGNVTYTISNEDPAVSGESFIIFPIAERLKTRPDRIWTDEERRERLGELVYSLTFGGETKEGSSQKLFEVGQILDFTDQTPEGVSTDLVPNQMEIQHNTNILDLAGLSLSQEEINELVKDSASSMSTIEVQLTSIQNQIADNKSIIESLQKKINEANKVLDALSVLEDEELTEKITKVRDDSITAQNLKISETNTLITESTGLRDQLLAISQLVR